MTTNNNEDAKQPAVHEVALISFREGYREGREETWADVGKAHTKGYSRGYECGYRDAKMHRAHEDSLLQEPEAPHTFNI